MSTLLAALLTLAARVLDRLGELADSALADLDAEHGAHR